MRNFSNDSGSRGGWGGGRGGDRGGRGGDRGGRPTMHSATCVECGNECEVPFKPNGLKPIYCRDCFQNVDQSSERPSRERNDRPSNDRPSFDKSFFDRGSSKPSQPAKSDSITKEQFEMLNMKLDYILKALSLLGATKLPAGEGPSKAEAKPAKVHTISKDEPKEVVVTKEAKPAKKAKKAK